MQVYLLSALAALVGGRVGSVPGLRLLWWVLPTGVLVLLAAGRGEEVGTDTSMYHRFFREVAPNSLADSLERIPQEAGYVTLMYVVRQFTGDFQVFLLLCSLLTVVPVLMAIRRASSMPVLSLFLYIALSYYLLSFNGIRQSIAVSLVLLAETHRRSSRLTWLLLHLLALSFHISVLPVFLLILAARWQSARPGRLLALVLGASAMGAALFGVPVVGRVLSLLNSRYDEYLSTEEGAGLGTVLVLAVHVVIAVWLILSIRAAQARAEEDRAPYSETLLREFTAIYLLSCGILVLATSNWVVGRLEPYFGIFAILALPHALTAARPRHALGLLAALVLAASVHFAFHTSRYNELLPYELGAAAIAGGSEAGAHSGTEAAAGALAQGTEETGAVVPAIGGAPARAEPPASPEPLPEVVLSARAAGRSL
ncbi:EpsG family protein [Brevibacterium album]|uniref:EpsG family protein n=1 Tax=Brevibacterium album TaxID=417948 RepID=UPI0012EC5F32|nr:EpsG family protein [Brevibacterium album]